MYTNSVVNTKAMFSTPPPLLFSCLYPIRTFALSNHVCMKE